MYSYGPPHMAEQKQDDQLGHTYSSYVRIRDVALKTYRRRWTIGRSGERGSGISVPAARHDDDEVFLSNMNKLLADAWFHIILFNSNNYIVSSKYFYWIIVICLYTVIRFQVTYKVYFIPKTKLTHTYFAFLVPLFLFDLYINEERYKTCLGFLPEWNTKSKYIFVWVITNIRLTNSQHTFQNNIIYLNFWDEAWRFWGSP